MAFDADGNWVPDWGGAGTARGVTSNLTGSDIYARELAAARTPQQDWANLMINLQPQWRQRVPMAGIGERLRSRYMLAEPFMEDASFSRYLGDYGQNQAAREAALLAATEGVTPSWTDPGAGYRMSYQDMLARARLAADVGGTRVADMAQWADYAPALAMRGMFGPQAQDQYQNQQDIVNLLAVQRGAGRNPYAGRMADSIRRAMGEVRAARVGAGMAPEQFLDWYLTQTAPTTTSASYADLLNRNVNGNGAGTGMEIPTEDTF